MIYGADHGLKQCNEKSFSLSLSLSLSLSGWVGVRGMRVYTSGDVQAVNGTDVWLKCTFETSATIRPATLVVSWSFRPLGPGHEESVFYYQEKPYPPMDGRFRKRAMWAGDIFSRDASIIIREVKFTYNGTFSCQVKNPPDVHGNVGEVRLRVVHSSPFSEIMMLALFIGGGIVLLLLALVVIVLIRRRRKKRDQDAPGARREYKDPTMW
ncbi:myelin protein zero-like protein 2 [Chanos chanos]|uniref:Myelin protein zero-like protein 2 n=1 Tax=Chanos chanos TaxID=29144 RepID=A0A6J2VL75_CHACN|nr:myelin protein zero-like protein 2 [Chanos chanos]